MPLLGALCLPSATKKPVKKSVNLFGSDDDDDDDDSNANLTGGISPTKLGTLKTKGLFDSDDDDEEVASSGMVDLEKMKNKFNFFDSDEDSPKDGLF